jgi:hypothetical protein
MSHAAYGVVLLRGARCATVPLAELPFAICHLLFAICRFTQGVL